MMHLSTTCVMDEVGLLPTYNLRVPVVVQH